MTTIINSKCRKCGIIQKSGKPSCCGYGGAWFKNCGSAGNTKLHHTWYEGIQACKARSQSKTVVGQQLNAFRQKRTDSSDGTDKTKSGSMHGNGLIQKSKVGIAGKMSSTVWTEDSYRYIEYVCVTISCTMHMRAHTHTHTSYTHIIHMSMQLRMQDEWFGQHAHTWKHTSIAIRTQSKWKHNSIAITTQNNMKAQLSCKHNSIAITTQSLWC